MCCSACDAREEMQAPLLCPSKSVSKPNVRKLSSSENLFSDCQYLHLQPQEKQTLIFSSLPLSPSRKERSTVYHCIGFIFIFFIITIAACLLCSNIDPPQIVEHASHPMKGIAKALKVQKVAVPNKVAPALKGLGTVFIRGTKVMSELVVAHITEDTQLEDLRLFFRGLYRSGVMARADVVVLFAWNALPVYMVNLINEENSSFHKLLQFSSSESNDVHTDGPASSPSPTQSAASISPFNIDAYKKASAENELTSQPFWGSRVGNLSHGNRSDGAMQQFVWGSIIGFDASELNPDDTLQGFFDHPPVELRRWACYQMLLGMVRHRFKHVLLTDVSGVAILGDPFALARRRMGLYLALEDRAWGAANTVELGVKLRALNADSDDKSLCQDDVARNRPLRPSSKTAHAKKQPNAQPDVALHQRGIGVRRRVRRGALAGGLYERVYGKQMWSTLEEFERTKKLVNSGAIVGGIHQIRGLANSMVTEIVKVALERTNRDAFPDSVLLSYLLHKSSSVLGKRVLDHLYLLDNAGSFVHSLSGSLQSSFFSKRSRAAYPMIQGNSKSKRWFTVAELINYDICTSPAASEVYADCRPIQTLRKLSVISP